MNKGETLALYAQGRVAWNAWAKEMLDKRAEMEAAGTWANTAKADFADHEFDHSTDFGGSCTGGPLPPDKFTPVIPDCLYFLGILQLLLSLVLIFLFLLAIRNQFRIR